jgi:protein AATF/BFR2
VVSSTCWKQEQKELLANLKTVEEALRLEKQLQDEIDAEKQAVQNLAEMTKEENTKAQHTKNQRTVWDMFLDLRIRLQPLLTTANCLPQYDIFTEFIEYTKQKDPNFEQQYATITNDIFGLIDDLLALQIALKDNNEETAAINIPNVRGDTTGNGEKLTEPKKTTHDVDSVWQRLSTAQEALVSYQNEVIEKWNSKTLIQAGINLTKLKALNQSAVKQVEQIMLQSKERLIRRSQLKREDYKILGKKEPPVQNTRSEVLTTREKYNPNDYDEEIYDDGDFYEMLLKELVESGTADVLDPMDMTRKYLNMKKLRKKRMKNVDRRASKGRKIKYVIHEKLVNFMAPQPNRYPQAYTETANQLFNSLFGKKFTGRSEESTKVNTTTHEISTDVTSSRRSSATTQTLNQNQKEQKEQMLSENSHGENRISNPLLSK